MRLNFASLKYFLDRFLYLAQNIEQVGQLRQQFEIYKISPFSDRILKEKRCDKQWAMIGDVTNKDGTKPFKKLSEIILAILTIFHSNADCERIFSSVRKVKTELRGKLSVDSISSILVQKQLQGGRQIKCYEYNPCDALLVRCKKSTADYLQALKDKKAEAGGSVPSEDDEEKEYDDFLAEEKEYDDFLAEEEEYYDFLA